MMNKVMAACASNAIRSAALQKGNYGNDKDALRYQLSEAKRKAAEQSVHLTAFGAGWRGRLGKWLVSLGNRIAQSGGR
jgi:hypothetical protein